MESREFQRIENELVKCLVESPNTPVYLAKKLADKCSVLLSDLEQEYEKVPPEFRGDMQAKLRRYRHEVDSLRPPAESSALGRAIRVAVETEHIGEEVGSDLRGQREQLLNARDRLRDTNEELSKASRLITAIQLNVISNKILLIVIIVIELAILLSLCYSKLRKK